ncbi:MAG TPA: hypothetical protein VE912_17435 [Bacteroidales bacterium]|nr:hypothetical protein [Bacteroidales bacterium]
MGVNPRRVQNAHYIPERGKDVYLLAGRTCIYYYEFLIYIIHENLTGEQYLSGSETIDIRFHPEDNSF